MRHYWIAGTALPWLIEIVQERVGAVGRVSRKRFPELVVKISHILCEAIEFFPVFFIVGLEGFKGDVPVLALVEVGETEFPLLYLVGSFLNRGFEVLGRNAFSNVIPVNHILFVELNYQRNAPRRLRPHFYNIFDLN